ncbi:MAG TPA: hypothetical protein VNK82_00060 [Terriglobales bacterium]|nr:hypothetical protein [Terriglobales bacterium]
MNGVDTTSECVVCTRLRDVLFDFLAQYQYDLSTDEEVRNRHAELGGFCPLHTWQYAEMASPKGVCTAYAEVCRAWSAKLREGRLGSLHDLPPGPDRCPACSLKSFAERVELERVAAMITAVGQPRPAPPLCLAHVEALGDVISPSLFRRLLEMQAEVYDEIARNMEEYVKNDNPADRRTLTQEQRVAHRVGLGRMVGHRRLVTPWEFEKTMGG